MGVHWLAPPAKLGASFSGFTGDHVTTSVGVVALVRRLWAAQPREARTRARVVSSGSRTGDAFRISGCGSLS